ncbi:MAG: hypothetical protein LC796_09820 [Acidobacteria bacterium]|nr:hypothetical protein [Acidobacteriota bacterium]MCA1612419.1 hypothetical protein [Acidobacteriota bacterium]
MTRPSPGDDAPIFSGTNPSARRPEVIVEFLFDRGLLFVAVRNIGDLPATGISIRFDPALHGLNGTREVSAQALFRRIEFLGPNREISTLLDRSDSFFGRQPATRLVVEVRYAGRDGQRYEETIRHDLEIFRDLAFVPESPTAAADPQEVP